MSLLLTPEHVHVALNHIPLIGLAVACIPLLYGLIRRQRAALVAGMLVALLCSASAPIVTGTGEGAAERFTGDALAGVLDDAGMNWIGVHSARADKAVWLIYAVALVAAAGLVAMWKRPRLDAIAGVAVLLLCIVSTLAMIWVADAGGKIRHSEFRMPGAAAPPPATGAATNTAARL